MMDEHENPPELSDEQKLQLQLEEICSEYQKLVTGSKNMAPKGTGAKRTDPTGENNVNDDDFEEIANVADNLNSLESALDLIEERADRIREQLLELLTSNREIRQSIREENDKLREDEPNDKPDADDASSSSPPDNSQNEPNNP